MAYIQAENLQNVQKNLFFWQKAPGVNGFKRYDAVEFTANDHVVSKIISRW